MQEGVVKGFAEFFSPSPLEGEGWGEGFLIVMPIYVFPIQYNSKP
jgi:hypothetical protein